MNHVAASVRARLLNLAKAPAAAGHAHAQAAE